MKTSIIFKYTNAYGDSYTETVDLKTFRDMVRAVRSPHFQLARARTSLSGYPTVLIYRRDANSPSGKRLDGAGPAVIVDRLLRKYRNTSALSPTELLTAPSKNVW